MGFSIPQFPLICNIFTAGDFTVAARQQSPCNLQMGVKRQTGLPNQAPVLADSAATMYLLLPATTDIRDSLNASSFDGVECPAGSGRYYFVNFVDDVAKGFLNEYRAAFMSKINGPGGAPWPTPIP